MIRTSLSFSSRSIALASVVLISLLALVACDEVVESRPMTPTPAAPAEVAASPTPQATPTPMVTPTPTATAEPEPTPEPSPTSTPEPVTDAYTFEILNTYPHDRTAFTQGLVYLDGYLYESTGLRGESTLRRVALESGEVIQRHDLAEDLFGEGIAIIEDRIFQLTWQSGIGFVYDRHSFEQIGEFTYDGEGWGLTTDGEQLIMSDGSNRMYFRDLENFELIDELDVYDDRGPVNQLNDLEYINGEIWANVWLQDYVVVIDPETGWVNRRIDLTGLLQPEDQGTSRVDVLNGIAYDAENDRVFVTGKLWPVVYEIRPVPR